MAAGLGFKDFVTGEVLTAADVDGYLMQGVWVFASAAARDAAVTSPQEGNFAYLKDTNVTTYYTGSAWANLDTTGMTNPMTTTGDTIYSSSGSTPARLGIGTANQQLRVNSGATAPEWFTPAAASSALTLTGSVDFTATQSIIVSNCFSSTYDYYVAYVNFSNISGAQTTLRGRLRVGGSSSTTGYRWNQFYLGNSSPGYGHDNADTSFRFTEVVASPNQFSCAQILNFIDPGIARVTKHYSPSVFFSGSDSYQMAFAGTHNVATAYTDLDLFPSTAIDLTGQVRVYGYAKS